MFYHTLRFLIIGFCHLIFGYKVYGKENIPKKGPLIIATNHLSFLDSPLIFAASPRPINFVAKKSYFRDDTLKHKFIKWVFTNMKAHPISREGNNFDLVLEFAQSLFNKGEVFGIYPEGTRSPDGTLYKGKTGIGRISIICQIPVIPAAMIDTDKAWPPKHKLNFRHHVAVKFGKLIYPPKIENFQELPDDEQRKIARQFTNEIMEALQKLSGQEYNPKVYALDIKKAQGEKVD